ncbi:hypothetical protein DXX94_18210 [Thalassotalea euphylliae]|uniref:Uncharacterized protein n=1 Tax=Thalassotalea euphylliae TaxID=1655234 RepID=A0A3E0U683_9GAMM|nr:hypothetical protein DXX94_18210 [Thalassotalea euphylliae]
MLPTVNPLFVLFNNCLFDQFILVLFVFFFGFWLMAIPLTVALPLPKQVLKKPVVMYFGCLRLLLIYTNHQLYLLMISVISQASVIVFIIGYALISSHWLNLYVIISAIKSALKN